MHLNAHFVPPTTGTKGRKVLTTFAEGESVETIENNYVLNKLLLIMNFTAIIFLATSLQVSALGHSQTITLSESNASLEKIFRELKRQTVYDFVPDVLLQKVTNVNHFLGILAFDKWAGNADARQCIFFRARVSEWTPSHDPKSTKVGFVAQMVDHGYIFEIPAAAEGPVESLPLKAIGRFVHEAVAVDPATGIV